MAWATLTGALTPSYRVRPSFFELHTLKFIAEGTNALIVGKPGTGKSHIAKAKTYQATLAGHDVRYLEANAEFARYALGSAGERADLLKDWVEPDLELVQVDHVINAQAEEIVGGGAGKHHGRIPRKHPLLEIKLRALRPQDQLGSQCSRGLWEFFRHD